MSGTANTATADTPQVLLEHHLKMLRLPTFLREYDKVARQCATESVDYPRYLGGAPHPSGPLSSGQELGHFRVSEHPIRKQGHGAGAGAVRISPAPGERAAAG